MTATWTDPIGTKRTGELLDQATIQHAERGEMTATLYRTPANEATMRRESLHIEIVVGGRTIQQLVADLETGNTRMAQFRAQAKEPKGPTDDRQHCP